MPRKWVGKTLIDLKVREKYGINMVGVVENGITDVTVDPHRVFVADSIAILIGSNKALKLLEKE